MFLITRLFQNIGLFFRTLFAPFRTAMMNVRSIGTPTAMFRRSTEGIRNVFIGARSRFSTITKMILPPSLSSRLGIGDITLRDKEGRPIEVLDESRARRLRTGKRLKVLQSRAQFSQIHLIDSLTQQRQIAHIGKTVERTWSELILTLGDKIPIRLTFTQVDPAVYGSDVVVTLEAGKATVTLDKQSLTEDISLPLYHQSIITINGRNFYVEMFAYDALPILTRVDTAWMTNIGPVRDDNQDAIGIYQHKQAYMFTVADGVGGGYAGDVVSEYAVKYLLKVFQQNIKYDISWYDVYLKAFRHINAEVRKFVEKSPIPAGTTLTSVFIRDWTAYVAHVGDSRVYHLRGAHLTQITHDHREQHPIERTTKYAHIPDELLPMRDVLVRAIGKRDDIEPEILTLALQPGDRILMVTDGITHRVDDLEIRTILQTNRLEQAPSAMVDLANERDNTDNASAIIIEVLESAYEQDIWNATASDRVFIGGKNWRLDLSRPHDMNTVYEVPRQVGCMTALVALILCFLVFAVPRWINPPPLPTVNSQGIMLEDTSQIEATHTLDSQVALSSTPTIDIFATTIIPTASTFPSATALPTLTRAPSLTPTQAPSATLIPPTSTLRA